jgi:heme-degrading monooxygenase HmoA
MMDAFIQGQLAGLPGLGHVPGLIRSHLYRANDDRDAILVSEWESEAAQRSFAETPAFHEHRAMLQTMIESASPAFYTLAYERNAVEIVT